MKTDVFRFCSGSWWDYRTDHNYDGLIKSLLNEFSYVGEGRHRTVFCRNDMFVIKAPRNASGLSDNWHEASVKHPNLCRCRLFHNVLLVMEAVNTDGISRMMINNELPDWTYRIDCGQVGFTRRGKLKAYDFGLS